MRILLIEDNAALAANVGEYLTASGCAVDFASDGVRGLALARANRYEVIVLDVGLPRLDGLSLCQRLRDDLGLATPVLMLTARDTLDDKLTGFRAGADDYLTKPFALAELQVRLEALVRRGMAPGALLQVGDLRFDTRALRIERAGTALHLSPTALRILELLMRRSPDLVDRAELSHCVWGDQPPDGETALRVHIHGLRSIIDKPFGTPLLHTVPGLGYRMTADDAR